MFGLFKKKPTSFKATIASMNQTIEVPAKMNLLQAALNAGIQWPHDCRVGSCGSCRCKLVEGKVKELSDFAYVLTGEHLKEGMILACQSELKTDIVVEVDLDQKALH